MPKTSRHYYVTGGHFLAQLEVIERGPEGVLYFLKCDAGVVRLFEWRGFELPSGFRALASALSGFALEMEREAATQLENDRCELCGHWFTALEKDSGALHDCDNP